MLTLLIGLCQAAGGLLVGTIALPQNQGCRAVRATYATWPQGRASESQLNVDKEAEDHTEHCLHPSSVL